MKKYILPIFLAVFSFCGAAQFEKGKLENSDRGQILYLEGTPYERGLQHGKLLKDQVQKNISMYIDQPGTEANPRIKAFFDHLPEMLKCIPKHFEEEMMGLADGSEVPYQKILLLNLFPEMFHCTGITTGKGTTEENKLYHVRVLDYAIGKDLEQTATIMVVKPDEGNSYLNVSYAGFIGSVTGMNSAKIAVGEIGGQGYGNWNGVPMAFLMREMLQNASTLDEAKTILQNSPRTYEYFYILSDGKDGSSCGVYATASQIHFMEPGDSYALFAPKNLPLYYDREGENDKFFTSHRIEQNPYQTIIYEADNRQIALLHEQPEECITLTGYSHPERYPLLVDRLMEKQGRITPEVLQEIIKTPVARPTNLHNAIFCPIDLTVWVSHANGDTPACDSPYTFYSLEELLKDL